MSGIRQIRTAGICILLACWALLAVNFISRTSHVSLNGVRYFSLFDDGMISMRYAKNLVEHHALFWNLGERVEGFSNPLWTLIMAIAICVFGTHFAPLAMQVLGGVICLMIFLVFCGTANRNKGGQLALFAGLSLLISSYPLAYWALTGMEASAICLAFAVAVSAQYSYENGHISNPLTLHAFVIAVAYGLRPDGWLVIAPFFAACWVDVVRQKEYRRALSSLAIIGATVSVVLLTRRAYYGEWVPNTYVLKMEGYSISLRLRNGLSYISQFYSENWFLFALLALSALVKRRIAFLNILAACISIVYQVYVGGDPWLYWRQVLPVYVAVAFAVFLTIDRMDRASPAGDEVPLPGRLGRALALIILFAPIIVFEYLVYFGTIPWIYRQKFFAAYAVAAFVGLAGILTMGRGSTRDRLAQFLKPITQILIVITVGAAIIVGNKRFLPELSDKPYLYTEQAKMIDKAVLSMKLFGSERTHHIFWAGTYPYYVEGTMIDALGKSDKAIARLPIDETLIWKGIRAVPGHSKYDLRETILRRKPDIIVDYTAWGRQDMSKEIEDSYRLIQSGGVSLCVKNELTVGLENLVRGSCPRKLI